MPTSMSFEINFLISEAMYFNTEFSIPKPFCPAKASPENLILQLYSKRLNNELI